MERSTSGDVEQDLESSGDELEERLGRLDDHIDDAKAEASARTEDTDAGDDVGDPEDTDDDSGGEDPSQFDDPDADEQEDDEE